MNRRAFLLAGGAWLTYAGAPSFAQAPQSRRIVLVHPASQAATRRYFETFRVALKHLGYVEGSDISIEARWAEGRIERLDSLVAEALALNPAVLVTGSSEGVKACMKATSAIPIVFATAADIVEQGFVSSLRHPGGNVTGIVLNTGLNEKIVEIAREALPVARRLAILVHDKDRYHNIVLKQFEPSARRFKFEPVIVHISRAEELDRVFDELAQTKADALFVPNLALLLSLRQELVQRTRQARLPLLAANPDFAEAGGLLAYGTLFEENWRRAATLVDKILRGAKAGDLPVEQPERFELVVSVKTARAIGVSLAPTTLLRADKVIE